MSSIDDDREQLVARWRALTCEIMPAMAAGAGWPVRLDHCFMRVCLDTAFGAPWTRQVARPAIRHMNPSQLRAAITVAEQIVRTPGDLYGLNLRSIEARRVALRAAQHKVALPSTAMILIVQTGCFGRLHFQAIFLI